MNGDLLTLLAGEPTAAVPVPFIDLPASEGLRRTALALVDTVGNFVGQDKARMLISFAQDSACGTVFALLDPDTDVQLDSYLRNQRRSVVDLDARLQSVMPLALDALRECRALGIPDVHCVLLFDYISSDSPRDRVAGVAALLTLSAIVQYSRGYYAVLAQGGTP